MEQPPDESIKKSSSYWLTRFVILRLLGVIYAVAFLIAINQIIPLIGSEGLLPVDLFIQNARNAYGSTGSAFFHLPSIFWFAHGDFFLEALAWAGLILSLVVVA